MGNSCLGGEAPQPQESSRGSFHLRSGSEIMKKGSISKTSTECKVIVLGDSAVGKTSIAMRFIENRFPESHIVTLGAKFEQPRISLKNGGSLKINLWDTSGEEKFRTLLPIYFRNINGALLIYDIKDKKSFESIEYWLSVLDGYARKESIVLYLVGNKNDIQPVDREVPTEIAQKFAEANGMLFTEVSAKTGEGIADIFSLLAEQLVKKFNYK